MPGFPAADACPADLGVVGKLLTVPAFCLPVSAEEVSAAPVQKQGVVVQNVLHRDAVKGGELVRQLRREAAVKCTDFQMERQKQKFCGKKIAARSAAHDIPPGIELLDGMSKGADRCRRARQESACKAQAEAIVKFKPSYD